MVTRRLEALTADLAARSAPKFEDKAAPPAPDAAKPPTADTQKFPAVAVGGGAPRAKTGPGQMLNFRSQMLAGDAEIEKLREQLKQYDGSVPAIKLDPKLVHRSKWANRDVSSFKRADFASLKSEIESAGGNLQPILVRPIKGREGHYETIFGHRRHQACLELGMDVLAMVAPAEMPDAQLFIAMDRENRERQDLSPYEQGRMYAQALEEKLFSSARHMADSIGVSNAWISKSMSVANLPAPVIAAFTSPLEIQPAQAKDINQAMEKDQRAVLKRAEKIRGEGLKSAAVAEYLIHGPKAPAAKKVDLTAGGRKLGSFKRSADGAVAISLVPGAVTEGKLEEVLASIRNALAEGAGGR